VELATLENTAPEPASQGGFGLLGQIAAKTVADSYLMHSTPDRREQFREELAEAIEIDAEDGLFVLAGLKAAGLGYRKTDEQISVSMISPRLSNPDPDEFSTQVSSALSRGRDAVEAIAEYGRELLSDPQEQAEMQEWLGSMAAAVDKKTFEG
jgi:hypothetical protein